MPFSMLRWGLGDLIALDLLCLWLAFVFSTAAFLTQYFFSFQIHEIHHKVRPESVELLRRDYTANGGWETFLSYEDPEKDILVGLLRLRKCSDEGTFRPELVKKDGDEGGCSIVRELHVYGTAVPVHGRDPTKFQHQVCPFLHYFSALWTSKLMTIW